MAMLAAAAAVAAAAAPPNILMIVMDDLGWDDVGFRSKQIRTPNIDNLAAEGVVLDRYYTQDVCSPARATFMTGRYPMHHGIVDWIPPGSAYGLPENETTLADLLHAAGYATHAVGKWHLGFYKEELTPTFRGFESFYGFYGGGEDYFSHVSGGAFDMHRDPQRRCGASCRQIADDSVGGYSTELFSAEAVKVVKAHDTAKPLFLYLAYQAVHSPSEVPASYEDVYNTTISDPLRRRFAGMLSCADEGIGNVTQALSAKGMLSSTLIVFTTDNGGPVTTTPDGIGQRNWPLRGGKHSIWEGGTRGTALVWGPGVGIAKGAVYGGLMHGADWLPTLCAAAGASSAGGLPLDGVSQLQQLAAPELASPRTGFVYGNSTDECKWHPDSFHNQCGFGIRDAQWKLLRGYGGVPDTWCNRTKTKPYNCGVPYGKVPTQGCPGGYCLYDVVSDPSEVYEVSSKNPKVVQTLADKMDAILASGYTEASIDPQCKKAQFINDTAVPTGKVWAPWC